MSKNVTSHPKIVLEWKKPLGDKNKPYAYRWRLDFYFFSFRIHKWLCSDDERAYHSHPVNMIIFIIKGEYIDHPMGETGEEYGVVYKAPCVRYIPRDFKHYVHVWKVPTWTLLFTWGVPKRWSFWDVKNLKKYNRDKYFLEKGNHICE